MEQWLSVVVMGWVEFVVELFVSNLLASGWQASCSHNLGQSRLAALASTPTSEQSRPETWTST